jgi:hypothetical protein
MATLDGREPRDDVAELLPGAFDETYMVRT